MIRQEVKRMQQLGCHYHIRYRILVQCRQTSAKIKHVCFIFTWTHFCRKDAQNGLRNSVVSLIICELPGRKVILPNGMRNRDTDTESNDTYLRGIELKGYSARKSIYR
jgi:hypothetical protein